MPFARKYFFTEFVGLCVLLLSVIPVPEIPQLDNEPFFDKWVHVVMYGGLAFMYFADLVRTKSKPRFVPCLVMFVSVVAFGGVIEFIQPYVGRSCEIDDWYADILGAAAGIAIGLPAMKLMKRLTH